MATPRFKLVLRRVLPGELNPHRFREPTLGPEEPFAVFGMSPGSDAAREAGRDAAEASWTVYYPATGPDIAARDVVVVEGVEYRARADSLDWSKGPWPSSAAGKVVELVKKEG